MVSVSRMLYFSIQLVKMLIKCVQAAGDDVSPQNLTDKLVERHCKNGANILVSLQTFPFPIFKMANKSHSTKRTLRKSTTESNAFTASPALTNGCVTVTKESPSKQDVPLSASRMRPLQGQLNPYSYEE